MSYYRTCPHCGAHLDPGEVCDCRDKENAAPGEANTGNGNTNKTNGSTLIIAGRGKDCKMKPSLSRVYLLQILHILKENISNAEFLRYMLVSTRAAEAAWRKAGKL